MPNKSIAALAWGQKSGKTIIALHGWLDNAASFVPIAPYLQDFRLIAIDFPGHGLSSHLPNGCYFHYVDYVADVINVLDHLGLEQAALLGHSLGAGIASIIAGVVPERITALGLIDGIGPLSISEAQMPEMMRKSISEYADLVNTKLTHYPNQQEAVQARLHASKMQAASAELLVARGLRDTGHGFVWRTDPRLMLKPLVLFAETQIAPYLKNITSKTCLLRPSPGWPYDEKVFTNRVGLLQNIEVHRVSGNHHIHMDNPEIVGPILSEFYKRTLQ